jgi:organic radical activating enzyme
MIHGYLSEVFVSFQGEGLYVGRRHLFIRMGGCNLRCRYCDTPDSLERVSHFRVQYLGGSAEEVDNPISSAELLTKLGAFLNCGLPVDGVALTGGEPLLQADFLAELLADERLPHPRLLETSGLLPAKLKLVLPCVDVVSMDIKLPSNTGERGFWEEHERFLALARGKVYVKVLVDEETAPSELDQAADLVRRMAPEAPVFLQPIADAQGRIRGDLQRLSEQFARMRMRRIDVRVLPQMHKVLHIP